MNDAQPRTAPQTVSARVTPAGTLDVLSRKEIARLRDATASGLHTLLREWMGGQAQAAGLSQGRLAEAFQVLDTAG